MRNLKKGFRSCLSVILMCGILLPYVPPVMAIDDIDEPVAAQEEILATEQDAVPEAEPEEDVQQPEPTKTLDEEATAEVLSNQEGPADTLPAGEDTTDKAPTEGDSSEKAQDKAADSEETPVEDGVAKEDPAEKTTVEEDADEALTQPEEILYTLTYSGLSDFAELEVRKLDPEDRDDADAIFKLQKQLGEQELYDAFEISMIEGEILDEEAGAQVTLQGYEVEDPEHTALCHFTDDGEIEELEYIAVDDEVSFVTKSFSPFVFAQAKEQEE